MDWTLVILSVVTFVTVGYFWVKKQYRFYEDKGLPFVPPRFPLGNLWGVGSTKHAGIFTKESYNYLKGKDIIGGIFFFVRPVVLVLDLDFLKNVLVKDFNYFQDRGIYVNEKDDPLSGHLFALSGQRWRNLRHKLSPTFTSGKMKMMHSTIVAVAAELQKYLETFANQKEEIELKDILARFTTDVIGSCAFGIECNSINDPDNEFRKMGRKIFDFKGLEFLRLFFLAMFPSIGRALKMRINKPDVADFFMNVLRESIEYREKNNIKRNDFLHLLIQIKNTGKLEDDEADLGKMTFEELAAQTFLFFLAGFETSSSTMSFAFYELAKDQKVQARAREEINRILEKHGGEYTYDACMEMKYIDQIIKETLRLHPIAPSLIRNLTMDYEIPDRDITFKKGQFFSIPVIGIHHDPDIYPNPEHFDPERFTEENIKTRHPYSWLPFGEGPRNCIGLRFGMMQTKVGLANILSKYKITPTSRTPMIMDYSPSSAVLAPREGMWIKIEKA
ncbi:Cytochrome P450 [Sergentomyia squamirostris]